MQANVNWQYWTSEKS